MAATPSPAKNVICVFAPLEPVGRVGHADVETGHAPLGQPQAVVLVVGTTCQPVDLQGHPPQVVLGEFPLQLFTPVSSAQEAIAARRLFADEAEADRQRGLYPSNGQFRQRQ